MPDTPILDMSETVFAAFAFCLVWDGDSLLEEERNPEDSISYRNPPGGRQMRDSLEPPHWDG